MMNMIWAVMCFAGLMLGMVRGRGAELSQAALSSVLDAVQLSIKLAGGFALWSGMLMIVERSGAIRAMTRLLSPLLKGLFPGVPEKHPAREAMAMNMAANMLGLGNAATPMGLRAMGLLQEARGVGDRLPGDTATDAMCMFLVINASSLQLFPSSVIALRAAAGSALPGAIVVPSLISTAVSTLVGVGACLLLRKWGRRRNG